MKLQDAAHIRREIERFLSTLQDFEIAWKREREHSANRLRMPERAAVRRASMDLTRKLADLRKALSASRE